VTTGTDINVRAARGRAAGDARAARRSALARLLLFVLDHVSKLDRKLLLLLVASTTSACIIPVGPEFQDPPGVPDSPPFLWMESPDEGTTLVSATATFSVTPGDYNLGDTIFVKWITDFPPFVPNNVTREQTTDPLPPSADGSPIRRAAKFMPTCFKVFTNPNSSTHRITAAISDREFDGQGLLTTSSLVPPRLVIWTWEQSCPGTLGP
jgi:hypothetical protein